MTYILDLQQLWREGEASQSDSPAWLRKNVVSAIIVAEADEEKLMSTIHSVLAQQLIREVIIVNCGGFVALEKSLTKFADLHSKCYVVNGRKRMGLASAYNLGAQYASGQYLLFLKENSLLPKNTVLKLLATGLRKPTPWVVGVQERIYVPPTTRRRLWARRPKKKSIPEVSLVGGGFHAASVAAECLLVPIETFLELRGMDRKCFHSTFHRDLCLRVHLAGGGVYRAHGLNLVIEQNLPLSLCNWLYRQWQALKGIVHFYKKAMRFNLAL